MRLDESVNSQLGKSLELGRVSAYLQLDADALRQVCHLCYIICWRLFPDFEIKLIMHV
jgi:hypothetical protein